jgi:hypothetical protein
MTYEKIPPKVYPTKGERYRARRAAKLTPSKGIGIIRRPGFTQEVAEPEYKKVYEPRGAARELWKCRDSEILFEGPAGTGKTRAVLEKILALAVKYGGSRHLIVRKTRAAMTESVLVTFETKVLPPGSPVLKGPQRKLRQSYSVVGLNGKISEIVVGGLDKPERTFSTEYDTITIFEGIEATLNDYESLLRALRNNVIPGYQQIIVDTNPGPQNHWLNLRAREGKMARLRSKHEDNPVYWNKHKGDWTREGKKYIAKLDAMSGARKLRLRFGKWASADGAVYPDYDPAVHAAIPAGWMPPKNWRRIRVCDFGYTNPFVCQWWALDPDERMYMYREIYFAERLIEKHAKDIIRYSAGETIEATICDHDPEACKKLQSYGIETIKAYKDIETGIDAVNARLKLAGNGEPRIFFKRDTVVEKDEHLIDEKLPTCTLEEIDCYAYKRDKEGRINKEEPFKRDDHGMDAMRYGVAYVDNLPWGANQTEEQGYIGAVTVPQ